MFIRADKDMHTNDNDYRIVDAQLFDIISPFNSSWLMSRNQFPASAKNLINDELIEEKHVGKSIF